MPTSAHVRPCMRYCFSRLWPRPPVPVGIHFEREFSDSTTGLCDGRPCLHRPSPCRRHSRRPSSTGAGIADRAAGIAGPRSGPGERSLRWQRRDKSSLHGHRKGGVDLLAGGHHLRNPEGSKRFDDVAHSVITAGFLPAHGAGGEDQQPCGARLVVEKQAWSRWGLRSLFPVGGFLRPPVWHGRRNG
jgi:hypothetical protein